MSEHPPALTPEPLSDRVRRGDLMATQCPSRDVLKHVTSRWGVLALMALEDNTLRFSALRQQIGGVSERMLAQTLRRRNRTANKAKLRGSNCPQS